MVAIDELVEKNSQFVIATHSPILMTYPKAEILEMTDTGIHKVKYSETEHYAKVLDYKTHNGSTL